MSTEPPRKHAGGRFPKGVSGNPGGKQKRHPEPPAENTPPKHKGGPWPKGVSGNPAGKPKGARHKTTLAMEAMLDGEADAITRKAIELAKEGDLTAIRICMERILPARKERPIQLDLPKINVAADLISAAAALTEAVAAGEITPGEAASLGQLVGNVAQAVEMVMNAERIARLEEALAAKNGA